MSEEINRREAELNEAALSGVSGGDGRDQANMDAKRKADHLCSSCCKANHSKAACRSKHWTDFADYLLKNGIDSVRIPSQCPYFND